METGIDSQIRIHTKQAKTTRGDTGEFSIETINAHTLTTSDMEQAVVQHAKLVRLVGEAEIWAGVENNGV